MLKLCALQLYNWGYSPYQVPLPIGEITLLRGPNGSGKTTYLSAIALLLGVRNLPKRQAIDKFIYPGETWAFLRGIADNRPDERNRRPFDAILPTFGEDQITLACLLERKEGNWQRSYFIVPGADFIPEPEQVIGKSYCFSQKEYRRALTHVGVHDTLLNLLELGLYGLNEKTRDSVACFKFFLKLVGDEEIQQRYEQARQEWWRQREQTHQMEMRQYQEEDTLKQMEEQIKLIRQRQELRTTIEQTVLLVQHARVRDWREQLATARSDQTNTLQKIEQRQQELATNQFVIENFEKRYQEWDTSYKQWRQQRDQTEEVASQAKDAATRTELTYQQQQKKVEELHQLPDIAISEAQVALTKAEDVEFTARHHRQNLDEERKDLVEEKGQLQNHQTPLLPQVKQFLQALQENKVPHLLVADAVEITDLRWQEAIEGALGGERYTVIVEGDQHQVAAKKLGQQLNYRFYVSPPNRNGPVKVEADSLWEVVRVLDERVRGWVKARLAHIRRVDTIEIGHRLAQQDITNVTAQAYLQEQRGGRSIKPRELVCGQAARQARLQYVITRLETLASESAMAEQAWRAAQAELNQCRERVGQAEIKLTLPQELELLDSWEKEWQAKQAEALTLAETYQKLKQQEDIWNNQRNDFITEQTGLNSKQSQLKDALHQDQDRLAQFGQQIVAFERQLQQTEPDLPQLDGETQQRFETEKFSADQYQNQRSKAEETLRRLPQPEYEDLDETLYQRQHETVKKLKQEVEAMRQRELEHHRLFEEALEDFKVHMHQLFTEGMHRAFNQLCASAGAKGRISLLHNGEDHWGLEVRVGFQDKPLQTLDSAPLSQGQEVIVGLFLVLSALRAVRATPILLLDELMSTLDENNAPLVMEQLRITGAQCFVATPHIRPQADALADAIWGLQLRPEASSYAPPVGTLIRGQQNL